ncbi:penicillin acylase family protein [Labilithrix luteola]|nr:penicillin acylase family protein [Labilithrix luteola]
MTNPHRFRLLALGSLVLGLVAASACSSDDNEATTGGDVDGGKTDGGGGGDAAPLEPFKATVRRTTAGVPHVKADDFGGAGYGYGYAFAEDNLCVLAEEITTVRGERSKYFGDKPYDLGNTASRSNVGSDAYYKMEFTKEVADSYREATPPDAQAMVRGFAAGVSRFVRELKAGQHAGLHAACRDAGWVREISDEDLYLRFYKLNLLASSATFIDGIVAAQPPGASNGFAPSSPSAGGNASRPSAAEMSKAFETWAPKFVAHREGDLGSNMYAFGSDVTGGAGIQFGNPHFPWYGGERLYQIHLTVPGKMDIQGSTLYGVPVVLIGFTQNFAWSHTVSTAYRFTPYQLKLKPGDPLTYIKDGQEKKITPHDMEIEVKQDDGSIQKKTVRLYTSEYGPMIYLGNSFFDWTDTVAYTIRDANAENNRLIRHFFRWNTAKSLDEFKQIHKEEVAVPWVNTTAADRDGNVYYGDITVVPNVPDALATSCSVGLASQVLNDQAQGLPLLDGSKAACDWQIDADSPQPGIFGAGHLPTLASKDYVVNCNDSYWLSNPKTPVTGFAKIIGQIDYAQSLRTRMCHQQVTDRLAGTDGLSGQGITVENVKEMVLRSRVYSAEKSRDAVTTAFCTNPTIELTKDPLTSEVLSPAVQVPVTDACTALKAWDTRNNADSKGSLLWDEFWLRVIAVQSKVRVYNTAFDPKDPLNTPRDIKVDEPLLAQAFAAAVRSVAQAGFAFDAPRSQFAYREGKNGEHIAIPGGFQRTGNFTIAQKDDIALKAGEGYGAMQFGNSYMQVVGFTPTGVDANTFVTYSESSDPGSDRYDDYTRLYSQKQWLKAAFSEDEVAADTKSTLDLEQ